MNDLPKSLTYTDFLRVRMAFDLLDAIDDPTLRAAALTGLVMACLRLGYSLVGLAREV